MTTFDIVNELSDQLAIKTTVPSCKDAIKIRPITVKQIKDLVDLSIDIPYFDIGFKRKITEILSTNSNYKTFTEIDVYLLFVYLKGQNFYKTLDIKVYEEHCKNIDLSTLTQDITSSNITVTLGSPLVERGNLFDDLILNEIKVNDKKEVTNEKQAIEAYFYIELARYIRKVKINDISHNADELSTQEVVSITKELPYQVASKITEFTQTLGKTTLDSLTIDNEQIPFDTSFFDQ